MDLGLVSAGAGLSGATIGAAMSFLGSWVVHQKEVRAQWLGQDRLRRQDLYKEFIQEASSAMLMHFNTKSRTFRCWSFFMVRSVGCVSYHLPKSLQLPSKC